jgi:adenylate cyclase class 2
MAQGRELEAKFLGVDVADVRVRLLARGFELVAPVHLLRRKIFRFPGSAEAKWVRVRAEYDRVTIAVKHVESLSIDGVRETELQVSNFDDACDLVAQLGLAEASYQENRRETWALDRIQVTVDHWPGLEPFVEIEADSEAAVRDCAGVLGFDYMTAVFGAVDTVYETVLAIPKAAFNRLPLVTFAAPPAG